MLIKDVARRTCRYITDLIPCRSPKTAKISDAATDIISSKIPKDTFELVSDGGIPKHLQAILDDLGPYYKDKGNFLTDLYKASPSKFDYIYNHKYFDQGWPVFNTGEFVTAVKKMSDAEITKTFDEIEDLYKTLPEYGYDYDKVTGKILYRPQTPNATNLAQLTILKTHNKEAYEYLLNHPNKKQVANLLDTFSSTLNGSVLETLTIPQIKQIEGIGTKSTLKFSTDRQTILNGQAALRSYVESSDIFAKNATEVSNLSKYLGASKVTEPFTAFRGNKDTGIFCSVILDDAFAMKTKWLILKNMFKAKKVKIHDYTGQYENCFATKTNLFKYIMGKKALTLADAMQVAKYGDDSYRKQIIEMIKNSQLSEGRFKSLTFDKKMATGWMPEQGASNTGILENATIKQGSQGVYSHIDNRQAEFVLNDNPKRITFKDAVYDADKNCFIVDSIYEPI